MPALLERKVRLLIPLVPGRGREATLLAAEIASEIEWAKARLVKPDGYEYAVAAAGRTPPRAAGEIAEIFGAYEREKRKRKLVDFDDLITGCADALERDADVRRRPALAVPPSVRRRVPRCQPRTVPARAGVAGRPKRPVRRRRRRSGDLRLRRCRLLLPRGLPAPLPARSLPSGRRRAAREQLSIHAAGRRGRQRRARTPGQAPSGHPRRSSRRPRAHGHRIPHRRSRGSRRRPSAACSPRARPTLVAHGRALPRQRAVSRLRRSARSSGGAVPRPWRRPIPRSARGEGRARTRSAPPLAPHPAADSPSISPISRAMATSCPRNGVSTSTRWLALAASTSRPRAAAGRSTASWPFSRPRSRATTVAPRPTTRWSFSPSTAPKAWSSTPSS